MEFLLTFALLAFYAQFASLLAYPDPMPLAATVYRHATVGAHPTAGAERDPDATGATLPCPPPGSL